MIPIEYQERFNACIKDGIELLDKHFPEIRELYGDEFEERLTMTLYLEMIRIGAFK